MKTAYILHGVCDEEEYLRMDFPSPSNAHWLPWLQQKFLRQGVLCQCLEMPVPYAPVYAAWAEVMEGTKLTAETTLVAHSAGAGFLLKWLGRETEVEIGRLVMVAPWLDLRGELGDFLKCELDAGLVARVGQIEIVFSRNEFVDGVLASKDMLAKVYPEAKLHEFEDYGHFCAGEVDGDGLDALWRICRV